MEDNKVNRILQDKINLLSKQDLEALGQSYVGKYAFVLYNKLYKVSKIKSYSFDIATQNGLPNDEDWRDRKKGDNTIYFTLENDEDWELVDIAVVGDTLNVRDLRGGGYTNLEITFIDEKNLDFTDDRSFTPPISRTRMITPMLMDIGWLENRGLPQMPTQQAPAPTFTSNSSKILNYLQVPQEVSDNFPEDIKEFVAIIEGSQEIYSESVDSNQKEKLAELIVTWMRQLMEFLQTQNLGIYGKMNVKLEQQTLPKNDEHTLPPTPQPPTPPQTPPPTPPPTPPHRKPPKPKPEPPAPPTPPEPPTPPQEEHQPPFTKEELEDAIASAEIMAEIGDEDGIKDLQDLRSLYNRYYS